MAKAKRRPGQKADPVAPEVRAAAILGYIRMHGSTSIKPMADDLGYNHETTRHNANKLVASGKLYRTKGCGERGRPENYFNLVVTPADASDDTDYFPPKRDFIKDWAPCHKRDLLVCALWPVPAVLLEARP